MQPSLSRLLREMYSHPDPRQVCASANSETPSRMKNPINGMMTRRILILSRTPHPTNTGSNRQNHGLPIDLDQQSCANRYPRHHCPFREMFPYILRTLES